MSESSDKSSHKERVAMRELVRRSNILPEGSDNKEVDWWLFRHGYLNSKGYKAPEDRVRRLQRNLGL